jgi:hypothetical protein
MSTTSSRNYLKWSIEEEMTIVSWLSHRNESGQLVNLHKYLKDGKSSAMTSLLNETGLIEKVKNEDRYIKKVAAKVNGMIKKYRDTHDKVILNGWGTKIDHDEDKVDPMNQSNITIRRMFYLTPTLFSNCCSEAITNICPYYYEMDQILANITPLYLSQSEIEDSSRNPTHQPTTSTSQPTTSVPPTLTDLSNLAAQAPITRTLSNNATATSSSRNSPIIDVVGDDGIDPTMLLLAQFSAEQESNSQPTAVSNKHDFTHSLRQPASKRTRSRKATTSSASRSRKSKDKSLDIGSTLVELMKVRVDFQSKKMEVEQEQAKKEMDIRMTHAKQELDLRMKEIELQLEEAKIRRLMLEKSLMDSKSTNQLTEDDEI